MTGEQEPPPFLHTWKNVYIMVIVYLALLIAVLFVLSHTWTVD